MSQHQQAFLADDTDDVARVARHVLTTLARGETGAAMQSVEQPSSTASAHTDALTDRLFSASTCVDPSIFASVLSDLLRSPQLADVLAYDMIPDIARRLGAAWVDDFISFADVTVGCTRLQSALRQMPDDVPTKGAAYNEQRRQCLVAVPNGAQHTLGALVLARQLRQAGQHAIIDLEAQKSTLSLLADQHAFDVIMLSASKCECPAAMRKLVHTCRQLWPASKIVIGGSISGQSEEIVYAMGADRITNAWQDALNLCN